MTTVTSNRAGRHHKTVNGPRGTFQVREHRAPIEDVWPPEAEVYRHPRFDTPEYRRWGTVVQIEGKRRTEWGPFSLADAVTMAEELADG